MNTSTQLKFKSEIKKLDKLKLNIIEIPVLIINALNKDEIKPKINHRVLITVNHIEKWNAGIVALGDGMGYITISNARIKKLKLLLDDSIDVLIEKDNSEFGHEFPIELTEYFNQDEDAKNRFNLLKPSLQRYILYYINQVKSSEKKIERTILLMNNLKLSKIENPEFKFLLGKQ